MFRRYCQPPPRPFSWWSRLFNPLESVLFSWTRDPPSHVPPPPGPSKYTLLDRCGRQSLPPILVGTLHDMIWLTTFPLLPHPFSKVFPPGVEDDYLTTASDCRVLHRSPLTSFPFCPNRSESLATSCAGFFGSQQECVSCSKTLCTPILDYDDL